MLSLPTIRTLVLLLFGSRCPHDDICSKCTQARIIGNSSPASTNLPKVKRGPQYFKIWGFPQMVVPPKHPIDNHS